MNFKTMLGNINKVVCQQYSIVKHIKLYVIESKSDSLLLYFYRVGGCINIGLLESCQNSF